MWVKDIKKDNPYFFLTKTWIFN